MPRGIDSHPELDHAAMLALYREWEKADCSRAAFAASKGINFNTIHKAFVKISNEESERAMEKARKRLSLSAPSAIGVLESALNEDDPKIRIDAAKALADRAGLSPQAATISIQNVQAGQAVIVPLLAESDAAALRKLVGGDE